MFAVFGVSGRMFSGTLEQLRQAAPVAAAQRTRAVEAGEGGVPPRAQAAEAGPGGRQGALAAYARTQQGPSERQPLQRVGDVMTRPVVCIGQDLSAAEAWQRMASQGLRQVPVVDAAEVLVGLLLRDSLLPGSLPAAVPGGAAWQALWSRPVHQLMWTPVPSVSAEADLRRVASLLLETGLPGLPVTDESGQVAAFVSRSDILRAVTADPPLDLWG